MIELAAALEELRKIRESYFRKVFSKEELDGYDAAVRLVEGILNNYIDRAVEAMEKYENENGHKSIS